eukprot:TRINITY_DN41468_c1_g1_i2.p1 TRINITY_DN41468_c1_g1~~TRINITY_DN41468_c1_g1_i2.p1  ORF type:complete len:146 (-),score=4.74 TRINITY_DN41468_c1_g1_i2:375-812(-)
MQHIYGLYIVSSADGLLYDAFFGDCAAHNASENTRIQLASAFASMSHIAKELSPVQNCTGIVSLEADTFTVEVFQTLTGVKFLLFVAPGTRNTRDMLKAIYGLYADYVMKDPYYELEQRIKSEALREMLKSTVAEFEAQLSSGTV